MEKIKTSPQIKAEFEPIPGAFIKLMTDNEVIQKHICGLAGIDNNLWRQYVHRKTIPAALLAGMLAALQSYVDTLNKGLKVIDTLIKADKIQEERPVSELEALNFAVLKDIGTNSLSRSK